MRFSTAVLVAFLAVVTSGCTALDRVNDALYATGAFDLEPSAASSMADCHVGVVAGDRRGRGVIVGPRTVLTIAHVVQEEKFVEVATSSLRWTRAKVVKRIASSPEDLIELEVESGSGAFSFEKFDEERFAKAGDGAPRFVLTATGARGWEHARNLRPGDSGSPVVTAEGTLVGVLVGRTHRGEGVLSPVGAPRSAPESTPVVVARLAAKN